MDFLILFSSIVFYVTSAEFEQVGNNDFILLEVEWLNDIIFPGSQTNLE